ncbi:hypothetical protein ACOSP7_019262 [Xanthoceras sorbifolium]
MSHDNHRRARNITHGQDLHIGATTNVTPGALCYAKQHNILERRWERLNTQVVVERTKTLRLFGRMKLSQIKKPFPEE